MMRSSMQRFFWTYFLWLIVAFFSLSLSGCQHGMITNYATTRGYMLSGNYGAAVEEIQNAKDRDYSKRDQVLFYMNKGLLEHYAQNYKASIESLHKAEQRSEELYTVSISKQAASLLTSDVVTDYEGEDFEKVFLNIYNAMNYLNLNDFSGALVEIRRVNEKLQLFNTRYEEEKNHYNQDAFAHWLSGILFEMEGHDSFDDALISYKKSYETYQTSYAPLYGTQAPPFLKEDLIRSAVLAGFEDEVDRFSKEFHLKKPDLSDLKNSGELIFIHESGEVPYKIDFYVTCYVADRLPVPLCMADWSDGRFTEKRIIPPIGGTVFQVAFPKYNQVPYKIRQSAIRMGKKSASSVLMEDIAAIAEKNLHDRMGRIFAKTVARAATKYAASKAIEKGAKKAAGDYGQIAGIAARLITGLATQATEEADKRSWMTLPAEIRIARMRLPPGTYDITLEFSDKNNNILQRVPLSNVLVEAQKKRFIRYRTLR